MKHSADVLDKHFIRKGRMTYLDGLRGLACLGVVFYHFGLPFSTNYPSSPIATYDFGVGEYGVQLFFMISGFVILLSAVRLGSPRLFAISRLTRLYPAYWVSLLLSSLLIFTVGLEARDITIPQVLANTTMFQRFMLVDNVDQVYWTLAVEMQFYILVFFYLLWKAKRGTALKRSEITSFLVAWSLLGLVLCYQLADVQETFIGKVFLWVFLAQHAPLFSYGIMVFFYINDRKFSPLIPLFGLLSAINSGLIQGLKAGVVVGLLALLFLAAAWAFLYQPALNLWLEKGPLLFFGKISYSLYLVHSILGYVTIYLAAPLLGPWAARGLAFAVVVALAYLLNKYVETKASRALRLWLEAKTTPA